MALKEIVVMLGPAGCGKTSLTHALGEWIRKKQLIEVSYINLDPGVITLPYNPDIDVREYVTVDSVMREYGLGPNGALIKSIDILVRYVDEIRDKISNLPTHYIIVDTPGQMELFLFRDAGPLFIDAFKKIGYPVITLIYDPLLTSRPQDVASLRLMSLVVQMRLNVDTVPVLNKSDIVSSEEIYRILRDTAILKIELGKLEGVYTEIAELILHVLDEFKVATRIPKVSARTGEGLEELYDMLHEIYCTCGDLT